MEESIKNNDITYDNTVTFEEYKELLQWTKDLEEGKAFLDNENKKMSEWIKKLETDKEELGREKQLQSKKINELEFCVRELLEKNDEYKQKILDVENEKAKLNYKINKYISNPKIKKIIEAKKLDQY